MFRGSRNQSHRQVCMSAPDMTVYPATECHRGPGGRVPRPGESVDAAHEVGRLESPAS
jgi:hypothetical protein